MPEFYRGLEFPPIVTPEQVGVFAASIILPAWKKMEQMDTLAVSYGREGDAQKETVEVACDSEGFAISYAWFGREHYVGDLMHDYRFLRELIMKIGTVGYGKAYFLEVPVFPYLGVELNFDHSGNIQDYNILAEFAVGGADEDEGEMAPTIEMAATQDKSLAPSWVTAEGEEEVPLEMMEPFAASLQDMPPNLGSVSASLVIETLDIAGAIDIGHISDFFCRMRGLCIGK